MYEGRTNEEAARKWRWMALGHVQAVASELGIDVDWGNSRWVEDSRQFGLYHKHSSRDKIEFHELVTDKIVRTIGDIVPVGEPETKLAVVQTVGPNDYDAESELTWNYGNSLSIGDVTSSTHGWSVTVTQGYEIGGDAAGGKYIGGLELGAHGEYSKERAEDKSVEIGAGGGQKIMLPAGEVAQLIQIVRVGPVEIDVEDNAIFRLGWRFRDWKNRKNDLLKDHAGYGGKEHSKSRWHWDCTDTNDFILMAEGHNPRYPNVRPGALNSRSRNVEWLKNEANRTMRVRSKVHAEQGVWGEAKIIRIRSDGTTTEESVKN